MSPRKNMNDSQTLEKEEDEKRRAEKLKTNDTIISLVSECICIIDKFKSESRVYLYTRKRNIL